MLIKNSVMLLIPIYGFPKFRGFGPRGICPMGILSLNIFVIRNIGGILSCLFLLLGDFILGDSVLWNFVQKCFCPRGICPRGFYPRRLCPLGFCPRVFLSLTIIES